MGTMLLAATIAVYALAMTIGRGQFGSRNIGLLVAALLGLGLFIVAERRAESPLVRLALFRNASLRESLAMSLLVSTVMMATLVVGPFYLSRTLGLSAGWLGLVLSIGPLFAAVAGVPAGRSVDGMGAHRMTRLGLIGLAAGCLLLSAMPASAGIVGYILPLVGLTVGYAFFQTANNTVVMMDVHPDQRGVISGLLNLSRNLGLITGASVMGALFTFASATSDITTAPPEAVATGMQITFAVAGALILLALVMAVVSRAADIRPLLAEEAGIKRRLCSD